MGWFEEQIKLREDNDNRAMNSSLSKIASAVTGETFRAGDEDTLVIAKSAVEQILRWYGITPKELPSEVKDINEQIDFLCRPHGFMYREVSLTNDWWKDAAGPMLGFLKEGNTPVALIPNRTVSYFYVDPHSGNKVYLLDSTEKLLTERGIYFYKPFPLKSMSVQSLLKYAWDNRDISDTLCVFASMAIMTGIGLLSTSASHLLMGTILESKSLSALVGIACFIIGLTICRTVTGVLQSIYQERIDTRRNIQIRSATMMRVLSLPPSFFKKYSSGDLSSRISYISQLVSTIFSMGYNIGLNSLFSLVYVTQIFRYAPSLVIPALIVIAANIAFNMISSFTQMRISRQRLNLSTKESGMSYAIITGIQKIRLAGAEKRFFARWGKLYAKELDAAYNPPLFIKAGPTISTAIGLIGTLLIYRAAIMNHIGYEDYYAFNTAYGMVYGALLGITSIVSSIAGIKPIIEMVEPIIKEAPELDEGKEFLSNVTGSIEVNNISFRYEESMPWVLRDLSLKIRPGQYVALVGKSGCGKSTLVRLLLGFEKPDQGGIFFDGRDLSNLDMQSLRQKIGTVTQNGKLFSGSIYENIVISAPWLSMDEAWEAAEVAGLADDIRKMPMGMHTMISEGSGGISGGQKQRIMIARAIAPKPRILIFDEATSALDNITQKKVSDALDSLKCTRIVIAHRLSTIQNCDRIIVLDGGRIIEDGTYDELIKLNGFFADLVSRQRLEDEKNG